MKKILLILIFCIFQNSLFGQVEGVVKNKNVTIHYRTFGKGKPILIINGGPGMNSNGFEKVANHLSQHYECILFDQRGTGKSVLPVLDSTTITIALMIEDLECLRNDLKIEKWIIIGHSFGGILASQYATLYPDHIESLILSSSGGLDLDLLTYLPSKINSMIGQQAVDTITYWRNKINEGDTSYNANLQACLALAPAYVYKKEFVPVVANRLTQLNPKVNALVWADLNRIHYDCKDKLASFKKPVLIIQGKQDIIEEKTAITEHAVFKNSKLVLLDNCSHYGWLDREKDYYRELEKFINAN